MKFQRDIVVGSFAGIQHIYTPYLHCLVLHGICPIGLSFGYLFPHGLTSLALTTTPSSFRTNRWLRPFANPQSSLVPAVLPQCTPATPSPLACSLLRPCLPCPGPCDGCDHYLSHDELCPLVCGVRGLSKCQSCRAAIRGARYCDEVS